MASRPVEFRFVTGINRTVLRNCRLRGSWDGSGRYSDDWTEVAMTEITGEDGCPAFTVTVSLDAGPGQIFRWGVVADTPQGANAWAVPTELPDANSVDRYRQFRLAPPGTPQTETYYLTFGRRLGANKRFVEGRDSPRLWFAIWAPNALDVKVVFGRSANGYIDDAGGGEDPTTPPVPLSRTTAGLWEGGPEGDYASFLDRPYMYRIRNAQGQTIYRTDIFSRGQIGKGATNPNGSPYTGTPDSLDGTVSCSLVIDPDLVRRGFASTPPGSAPDLIPADEFWRDEFTQGRPVPTRVEDLVIYELHVNSLGFGKLGAGDLSDAIAFLDHLAALGVNAVELMPMAETGGNASWGYGDSHHLCIEASAGGRDKYRHFVRACHQRGIAVIQDVVYNHYDSHAARAEWQYDSTAPEQNIFYWYEGAPSDYRFPEGGYLNNGSSGFTPRFWEEVVRQQFISSAVFLAEEMHVDGFRVDLTQAMHRDNTLNADGRSVGSANVFGQKLLREWNRTLKMLRPTLILIAEDHTGWDAVTKPPARGGLGFDATWDIGFYHSLIGDSDMAGDRARLLKAAGTGGNEPLRMDAFSAVLFDTHHRHVIFHESHDEAGNAGGTARTAVVAVNGAAQVGETRVWAEARSRLCFGLSLLSAGTPMFFMGEEIGARKPYTFDNFLSHREDILGDRAGSGSALFRFYQDLITLSRRLPAIRSPNIDILWQSNADRVIAFKRWAGDEQVIIAASLNNAPFASGYTIRKDRLGIPDGGWREIFNSDSSLYGGANIGNGGAVIGAGNGGLTAVIPAAGFVVLVRQ